MYYRGLSILAVALLLLLLAFAMRGSNGRICREVKAVLRKRNWSRKEKLILAIAKHETGNFRSNVFRKCQNLFGIKTLKQTDCLAPVSESPGVKMFYKKYNSVSESVNDFLNWLESKGANSYMTDDQILNLMKVNGYFQDLNYSQKLKRWMN